MGKPKETSANGRTSIPSQKPDDFLALDAALAKLEAQDSRQAKIVELHFFGGLTFEEISDIVQGNAADGETRLECSPRVVAQGTDHGEPRNLT